MSHLHSSIIQDAKSLISGLTLWTVGTIYEIGMKLN